MARPPPPGPPIVRAERESVVIASVVVAPAVVALVMAVIGNIEFDHKGSGGLKKMLENKMTGQGLSMMICRGEGEVFLAVGFEDHTRSRVAHSVRGVVCHLRALERKGMILRASNKSRGIELDAPAAGVL